MMNSSCLSPDDSSHRVRQAGAGGWSWSSVREKKISGTCMDLNLDEIKNALRLLSVNGETNLMNLIRL